MRSSLFRLKIIKIIELNSVTGTGVQQCGGFPVPPRSTPGNTIQESSSRRCSSRLLSATALKRSKDRHRRKSWIKQPTWFISAHQSIAKILYFDTNIYHLLGRNVQGTNWLKLPHLEQTFIMWLVFWNKMLLLKGKVEVIFLCTWRIRYLMLYKSVNVRIKYENEEFSNG